MILEIDENTTIADLQTHFSASFPFLKLGICKEVELINKTQKWIEIKDTHTTINQLRKNRQVIFIEIHYWQKTKTVDKIFHDKAGLVIKIMRKQGEHWIETCGTDELTLEEQNDIGRKASQELLHGINRPIEFEKPA